MLIRNKNRYGYAHFSSQTDLWATPLDLEFHFTIDLCAIPEKCQSEREPNASVRA
jgi:hypothetical protein